MSSVNNKSKDLKKLSNFLAEITCSKDIEMFFDELLTKQEIHNIELRWKLLHLLKKGHTQRDISKKLQISLCKITRGSRILKNKNSLIHKIFQEEYNFNK